ncbi:MAG TPA: hypothetical protein VGL50_07090 [Steroidobacteraceae bacterium]
MPNRRNAGKWLAALMAAGVAGLGQADITVQQQINVDGFGPSKFGAMEGKSSTAISGDRARTEQQTQFKSRLLRALAKGSNVNTVRIVRLDAETIDEIDVTKQQYTEQTFQQMRDQMQRAMQSAQNSPQEQKEAPSGAPVDDSKCQWSPPKTEVKQSGEHASIAGADAARNTITVTTTCTDSTKGTSCDFVFLLDEWLAADVPGSAETRAFYAAYAQKLNLSGVLADNLQTNSPAVFNRYQNGWGEALKQAGTLKGVPMKTVFVMQFGGPQCKDNSSGSGSSGGSDSTASGSSSSSGSSLPTAPSAAISGAAMSLFNKMHKKDDSQQQQQQAAPQAAPGMVQMFQMSTETTGISIDSIPGGAFQVPAGYKKVDKPGM